MTHTNRTKQNILVPELATLWQLKIEVDTNTTFNINQMVVYINLSMFLESIMD